MFRVWYRPRRRAGPTCRPGSTPRCRPSRSRRPHSRTPSRRCRGAAKMIPRCPPSGNPRMTSVRRSPIWSRAWHPWMAPPAPHWSRPSVRSPAMPVPP
ncbi:hypothetical protein E3O65_03170 [Cryobacterium breve]|uniref:Uncharacterized protein n=1 Tax=Cryobacterium breve TaxID=1259258 RepID=A0ABY2J5P8_9MICO|nr:hypothetical protein E3T20_04875 [Cryobacterium sp. TmT3-12]TFD00146.1 hypothetical protein E3O65_03170 [Cryobacterium breve]